MIALEQDEGLLSEGGKVDHAACAKLEEEIARCVLIPSHQGNKGGLTRPVPPVMMRESQRRFGCQFGCWVFSVCLSSLPVIPYRLYPVG